MSRDFTIPNSPTEYVMLTLEQMKTLTLSEARRVNSNGKNVREVFDFSSHLILCLGALKKYHNAETAEDKQWRSNSFYTFKKMVDDMASDSYYGKRTYPVYFSKEVNDV